MIRVLKSKDRLYVRDGAMEMWKTFDPADEARPLHRRFRNLESLNEVSLPLGVGLKVALDENHDVVTYVRDGGLVVRTKSRREEQLGPGSYQRSRTHPWMRTRVPKTSTSQRTSLFVSSMKVHPEGFSSAYEHKLFPYSERHGRLRLVASSKGEDCSLQLGSDDRIYSSMLDKGHHLVHELQATRGAWLQVVAGRIRLIDQDMETGDGASMEDEAAVSFTAQEASEILLYDLA